MLLFLVVFVLGTLQVGSNHCRYDYYTYGTMCKCFITETTDVPTTFPLEECGSRRRNLIIEFDKCNYKQFILPPISLNIAPDYLVMYVTIKNSVIDSFPADAFPRNIGSNGRTWNIYYQHVIFQENTIFGHIISYNSNDGKLMLSGKNITKVYPILHIFKNLKTLSLDNNNIESIDQSFVNNTDLTELNLSNNHMLIIDNNTFAGLVNLQQLNLSGNQIMTIYNAFKRTEQLTVLNLSDNNITKLNITTFQGLSKLITLDLSTNQINSVDNAFINTKALQTLNLSHNNISKVNFNTFAGLSNLESLDLSQNKIISINHAFIDLERLNKLNLSYNQIKMCDFDTFTGLSMLQILDLSHNDIVVLDKTFPIDNPMLTHLNISYNKLTTLNTELFNELPGIQIIDINNNNMNCHHLLAYTKYFMSKRIKIIKGTQRDGIDFQGIACNNETIDKAIENVNNTTHNNDLIANVRTITNITNEQIIIPKDIDKMKENETSLQEQISILKSIEARLENLSVVVLLAIIIVLFVCNILFLCNHWTKIKNVLPCKTLSHNQPNDCEVEMNTQLL